MAEALFDELHRRLEPALELLAGDGDPVSTMLAAIERLTLDFEINRRDAPLYLEALVAATRPGPYASTARKLLHKVRALLRDHLVALSAAKVVPGWVDSDAMAALILAVANGLALQVSIDPRGPGHREIAGQFAALLVSVGPPT